MAQAVASIKGKESTPVYITLLRARERDVKLLRAAARSGQIKTKEGQLVDASALQRLRDANGRKMDVQEDFRRNSDGEEGPNSGEKVLSLANGSRSWNSQEHSGVLESCLSCASMSSDDIEASPRLILETYTSPQGSVNLSPSKSTEDHSLSTLKTDAQDENVAPYAAIPYGSFSQKAASSPPSGSLHSETNKGSGLNAARGLAGENSGQSACLSHDIAVLKANIGEVDDSSQAVRVRFVEARGVGTVVGLGGIMGVYCCASLLAAPREATASITQSLTQATLHVPMQHKVS